MLSNIVLPIFLAAFLYNSCMQAAAAGRPWQQGFSSGRSCPPKKTTLLSVFPRLPIAQPHPAVVASSSSSSSSSSAVPTISAQQSLPHVSSPTSIFKAPKALEIPDDLAATSEPPSITIGSLDWQKIDKEKKLWAALPSKQEKQDAFCAAFLDIAGKDYERQRNLALAAYKDGILVVYCRPKFNIVFRALCNGDTNFLKLFTPEQLQIHLQNASEDLDIPPFYYAKTVATLECIPEHITTQDDACIKAQSGATIVHYIARGGQLAHVDHEELISYHAHNGVDVTATTRGGRTALHWLVDRTTHSETDEKTIQSLIATLVANVKDQTPSAILAFLNQKDVRKESADTYVRDKLYYLKELQSKLAETPLFKLEKGVVDSNARAIANCITFRDSLGKICAQQKYLLLKAQQENPDQWEEGLP